MCCAVSLIKNLHKLLHAWRNIEFQFPSYQSIIVGDGPEYLLLQQLILDLNLSSVKLLGLRINWNIAKIFTKSDALILASYSESWGMVVNEAMAAGLPVILSDRINAAHIH